MAISRKLLLRDIEKTIEKFPKLKPFYFETETWLKGEIDICDNCGEYWDSFKVKLIIHSSYPYDVPTLIELDNRIPEKMTAIFRKMECVA